MSWQLTISGHVPAEQEEAIIAVCQQAVRMIAFGWSSAVSHVRFAGSTRAWEWDAAEIEQAVADMTGDMLADIFLALPKPDLEQPASGASPDTEETP